MVDTGGDDADPIARRAANASVNDEAWEQTVEEARAMAADRRDDGWTARVVPAGHAAAVNPTVDAEGRNGVAFVVPGNHADDVERLLADYDLTQYDVYGRTVRDRVFVVVEYFDPDEAALFVAGNYKREGAAGMAATAREDGVVRTYLRKLDGTPVAEFEHADVEKFVPDGA